MGERTGIGPPGFVALAVAFGLSCNAIESSPSAPVNSCPDSPCTAYVQPGAAPTCQAGTCLVSAASTGLVVVVDLPGTSSFAPGGTFATPFDNIFDAVKARPIVGCLPPSALGGTEGGCASLPVFVPVEGAYLIAPKAAATDVGFSLGNASYTALPAQATFQLLWPPTGPVSGATAASLGIPVEPVDGFSQAFPNQYPPGPGSGPAVGFRAYLQPGNYEVDLRPTAPFDTIFGPNVADVTISSDGSTVALPPASCQPQSGGQPQLQCVDDFDVTKQTEQGPTIPTFDISRADGLDGWSAYLRDSTGLVVSNVAALAGSASQVILATHHLTMGSQDALTGTALVIQPPAGVPFPTAVFAPIGNVLPATETYPTLPAPTTISGSVFSEDGTPVAANLVFDALAIVDANGLYNTTNFEFSAQAQARPSGPFGLSTYSIELPQGRYRLSVRPLDLSTQVTSLPFVVGAQSDPAQGNVVLGSRRIVSGRVAIADGRPLSEATIDASPASCLGASFSSCLPREATTTTAADGSFGLVLDPGQYLLRVLPAAGTRLPWTAQPLSVGAADGPTTLALLSVPAPAAAGLKLVDPNGHPVDRALVRFFATPPSGPLLEVGRTQTASDGTFEMYFQPQAP